MSWSDEKPSDSLPTRSRTLHGEFPPDTEKVDRPVDPEVQRSSDHHAGESPGHRHRRRKSRSHSEDSALFSQPVEKNSTVRQNRWILPLTILAAILLAGNFFVGRFFYQSGFSAGMQRALAADAPLDPSGSLVLPQAKIFNAVLNLRSSSLDRPTIDLLTPVVLAALQETPKEALPDYLRPGHTSVEDFAAAYVAMRLGDFGQAAAILRDADKKLPPDQFSSLMNDPALREFAREPRVMGFY